jgi:hypothetical protein
MKGNSSVNFKTGLIAAIVGGLAVGFSFYANGFCSETGFSGTGWGLTLPILFVAVLFCVGSVWLGANSFGEYGRAKKTNGKESVLGLLFGIIGVIAGGMSAFTNGANIVTLFIF